MRKSICKILKYTKKTKADKLLEEYKRIYKEKGWEEPKKSDFTCNSCGLEPCCSLSWDITNIGGFCLAQQYRGKK